MAEALLAAARRGVRVVVLTPGKIDHNIVRSASRRDFGRMLLGGIEIFEYQAGLLHAKTMVVDGILATIGGTNLNSRSFAINDELNLVVYDGRVAGHLEKVFRDDRAHSRRVDYESWKNRGFTTKLFELFVIPIRDQLQQEPRPAWHRTTPPHRPIIPRATGWTKVQRASPRGAGAH